MNHKFCEDFSNEKKKFIFCKFSNKKLLNETEIS